METCCWALDKEAICLDSAEIVLFKLQLDQENLELIVSLSYSFTLVAVAHGSLILTSYFLANSGLSLGGERLGVDSIFGVDENRGINLGSFLNVSL